MSLFLQLNHYRAFPTERDVVRQLIRIGAHVDFEFPFWHGRSHVVAIRFRGLKNVDCFPFDEMFVLDHLRGLDICNTDFDDQQSLILPRLRKLEFLFANTTHLTSTSAGILAQLDNLKMLDVRNCRITKEAICQIKCSIPECKIYHD